MFLLNAQLTANSNSYYLDTVSLWFCLCPVCSLCGSMSCVYLWFCLCPVFSLYMSVLLYEAGAVYLLQ